MKALSSRASLVRLALLWLAGADLRLSILAVPPVLPLIHHDLGLSEKAIGLLSGLPILLLGLMAVPGSALIARIGARRSAILGLGFVALTAAARGIGSSWPVLFGMTVLMGTGVAVIQPALPTLVAEWFGGMGFASAVYANGLLVGEAIPAALTLPLVMPLVGGLWPASLAVWSLPVMATALLIALLTREGMPQQRIAAMPARWWPDWRNRLTWQLGALMGGTGGLYFSANAFIPDYLHAIGRPDLVAAALGALNSAQLPAAFLLLFTVRRLSASRTAFVAMPLLAATGLAGLFAPSGWLIVLGAGAMGFFGAFVLILTLSLPPQIIAHADVHRLSAGMFAVGYGLTCTIPLIGGAIWDATGVPGTAFIAGAVSSALVAIAGLSLNAHPNRPNPERPNPGRTGVPSSAK
jgi:CP family cyanate transporter-like MFS transporter